MTLLNAPLRVAETLVPTAPVWRPRSEPDLAAQQLRGMADFHAARRLRQQAASAAADSRELRMDAARSLEVLGRQHDALVARSHEQLRASGGLMRSTADRRVVLAHRNDWLVRKLTRALEDRGVHVVARTENGADAVGLIVAEQPDLVLVEDALAMLGGLEVVREVRQFSPDTVVTAQAAYGNRVGPLLDAGATSVFTRQLPPDDVARALLQLIGLP